MPRPSPRRRSPTLEPGLRLEFELTQTTDGRLLALGPAAARVGDGAGMSGLSTLYFPAGALIGLASAAPVGPVNLLVIQRTLTAHTAGALLLGAAGATGDALFAAAAAFGVGAVARTCSPITRSRCGSAAG